MRNPCLRLLKAILGNWTWSQWGRFKQNWGVSASEAGTDRDPWATRILKSVWNLGNFKRYCGCWKKPWATKFVQRVPEKKLALGHLVLNCCDYQLHIYGVQWIIWTAKRRKSSMNGMGTWNRALQALSFKCTNLMSETPSCWGLQSSSWSMVIMLRRGVRHVVGGWRCCVFTGTMLYYNSL